MTYRPLLTMLVVCCLAPRLLHSEEGVFDSNGVKIRYVTAGTGEPVVLIHGWMADSSMWGRDPSGNTRLNTSGTDHMTTLIKPEFGSAIMAFLRSGKLQ